MKFNGKLSGMTFVVFGAIAALLFILSVGLKFVFTVVVVGTIAAVVVGTIFKKDIEEIKQAVNDIKKAKAQSEAEAKPEPVGLERTFEKLKTLNLEIKLKNFPKKVVEKTEEVIDKLVEILPKLSKPEFAGSNIAWVVNQSAERYLGDLFKEYGDLSRDNKEAKADEVCEKLETLMHELNAISGKLEKREVDEFETESEFWKRKFMGESVKM